MALDKKEFSRLSPGDRIKRLKSLGEEKKKEVDEIEKLILDSMKELKFQELAGEIAPEPKAVDISRLFEADEEHNLEGSAKKAKSLGKGANAYSSIAQSYRDYSQLKAFYGIVGGGGSLTEEQLAAIGSIGERLNFAEKYMTEGEKSASKLIASRAILYKLKKETGIE
ncbi:hypothetical protein HYS31_05075 [Candidatus Woesearchaeota archaeon]|nr:hypothetical protein [Candidatus Woesearchaeota archaeon]